MSLDRTIPCLVCGKRRRRFVNGCCERCNALVQAEGTYDQLGVSKLTASQQRQRKMAAEYNRLIGLRMSQKQIAQLWGMTDRQVSSHAYRWRKSGLKVTHGWGNQIEMGDKPKVVAKTQRKVAQHGVGWGVTGCTCELCKVSSRTLRAQSNVRYRKRRKLKRQAAKLLAAE
jgi:hypothetical protein